MTSSEWNLETFARNKLSRPFLFPFLLTIVLLASGRIAQADESGWRPTEPLLAVSFASETSVELASLQTDSEPEEEILPTADESFRPLGTLIPTEAIPQSAPLSQASYFQTVPETPYQVRQQRVSYSQHLDWSEFSEYDSLGGSLRNDLGVAFRNLDDDFVALWEPRNILFLGTGLGISLAMRNQIDGDTRAYVARHPKRWGKGTEILGYLGNTEIQIAGIMLLYSYSYWDEDDELMAFTRLLIRTYSMTGLATVGLKAITNTDRPSGQWTGGQFGFPSAHVSTSFAIAATIEEYYGPQYGIPAYILAGLIGWSRIDEQDHDVSDVVFGAFLGYAIAKSISGRELRNDSRIQFFPWVNPNDGSLGGMMELTY